MLNIGPSSTEEGRSLEAFKFSDDQSETSTRANKLSFKAAFKNRFSSMKMLPTSSGDEGGSSKSSRRLLSVGRDLSNSSEAPLDSCSDEQPSKTTKIKKGQLSRKKASGINRKESTDSLDSRSTCAATAASVARDSVVISGTLHTSLTSNKSADVIPR